MDKKLTEKSVKEAYTFSKFRKSRHENGQLNNLEEKKRS